MINKLLQLLMIFTLSFLCISCNEQINGKTPQTEVEVPEWAAFFDNQEYTTFITEVNNYFLSLNLDYKIDNGTVIVEENEFGFDQLGLGNIAQLCKQAQLKDYQEIIIGHFNGMIEQRKAHDEFLKIENNFEAVKPYIGVRLYNEKPLANIGKDKFLGKEVGGDVFAMLIYDLANNIVNITPKQLTVWNKTVDELFDIGVANIKVKYPLTVTEETLGNISFYVVQGEHFFSPNIVLDMENRKELIGRQGSLIGLPTRQVALIYPIENLEILAAINSLVQIIYETNKQGPGSLSNQLFWYKDKVMTPLPYQLTDEKLEFNLPEKFIEIMTHLEEPQAK